MKIGIVGAGGVGGTLAALLARSGRQVAVLARGAHLEAIQHHGLSFAGQLAGAEGELAVRVTAASRGAELGPCDVVLVGVKTFHLEETMPHLKAMVGDGTLVVPFQNGIGTWGRLAAELGAERVIGGIIYVNSWVEGPGRIKQIGPSVRVVIGERGAAPTPRLAHIAEVMTSAGVAVEVVPDVVERNWEKFLGFEPMAVVGALSRSSIGVFRADPDTRRTLVDLMYEVAAIGRRSGVGLDAGVVERRLAGIDGLAVEATISMQRDLMAGRRSELFEQSVDLLRLARELGVATPIHDVCVPMLVVQERAARS